MNMPCVSIIMAVYNTSAFLSATLESLLAQTLADFEILCVDDGSRDGSRAILESFALKDPRIRVDGFEQNRGLANALNHAVRLARAPFILIADSDDLYMKEMLAEKLAFMQGHSDVVALGSSALFIDEAGVPFGFEPMPESDAAARWRMCFNSPIFHAGAMVRAQPFRSLSGPYDTTLRSAVDYDMFSRLAAYGRMANLRQPHFQYRIHNRSVSALRKQNQIDNRDAISSRLLDNAFPDHGLTRAAADRLRRLFINKPRPFDPPSLRPFEKPTQEDLGNYQRLLARYVQSLKEDEASAFLEEEYLFLGPDYLERMSLSRAAFKALAEPAAPLDTQREALFLDIDGTLLDIAPAADQVLVPPALLGALAGLQAKMGGALAVLTGRPLQEVDQLFAPLHLPCAALHGGVIRLPDGVICQRASALPSFVSAFAYELVAPYQGVKVEEKGSALAIHYRQNPDCGPALYDAVRVWIEKEFPQGILLHDRKTIEITSGQVDKGAALKALMQEKPFAGRTPVFFGDSETDKTAMDEALRVGGRMGAVGRSVGAYAPVFASPHHLRSWLLRALG